MDAFLEVVATRLQWPLAFRLRYVCLDALGIIPRYLDTCWELAPLLSQYNSLRSALCSTHCKP
jgi:hypothetical protein